MDKKIFGMGILGFVGKGLPKWLAIRMADLTSNEEMVGINNEGERKVFVDPDWYSEAETDKREWGRWSTIFAKRSIVFGLLCLGNKIKNNYRRMSSERAESRSMSR